jgi:hypothetical protein
MTQHILVYKYEVEGYVVADGPAGKEMGIANAYADSIMESVNSSGHDLCASIEVIARVNTPGLLKELEDTLEKSKNGRVISHMETKS